MFVNNIINLRLMSTESPTALEQINATLLRIKKMIMNFLDID